MKMVVVFSVNGSLASYSIEYCDASHAIAQLVSNGDKRKDLPEKIEFFQEDGLWASETKEESIKKFYHSRFESFRFEERRTNHIVFFLNFHVISRFIAVADCNNFMLWVLSLKFYVLTMTRTTYYL